MQNFEKLGAFYLGRPYDLAAKQPKEGIVLYDSKDLTTHAVCVGMTGSGKTGLCVALMEEAAIDGIPALIIDPKGDLANLMLTFPALQAADFAPWINVEDAQRKGLTPDAFAAQQAELWTKGLAQWGQDGARIQRLKDAAEFVVYTPGSDAGIPVSVLKSFDAPPAAIADDRELFRERVNGTVTALLGLLGIDADPIQSREHILLANILDRAWREGESLDIAALIHQIQSPPMARIGVLDVESFFPSKDRFALAMGLNNLLAAPGFEAWMEGEPLDIGRILYTPAGKPRHAIFSIAHLNDAERMFFVSLLLNQFLSWVRGQSGTTSLRALLYMDEIFGYFPPVQNPPSKTPLLTLLKQARAFGVGIVLATQNPVDLDYKGLSNTGTWFIGRLQTERDKNRVLDGLEGAAAGQGARFDRARMEQILAGLGNRVFLLNNVHEDAPEVFETRWAMSYLRGPMTRSQIKQVMGGRKAAVAPSAAPVAQKIVEKASARPVLPPEISQHFIPTHVGAPVYAPLVYGAATVRFTDTKTKVDVTREVAYVTPVTGNSVPVDWGAAEATDVGPNDLESGPQEGASFGELCAAASKAKSYAAWNKDFVNWLFANEKLELYCCPSLGEFANAEESERDFRIRLQQAVREERDRQADKLRQKYAPKQAVLQERLRRVQQALAKEQEQAQQQKFHSVLSIGTSLLDAFMGRKLVSKKAMGAASTAARGVGRAYKETQDVGRASETVEAVEAQINALNEEFQAELATITAAGEPEVETLVVKPKKTNISVRLFTLVWAD